MSIAKEAVSIFNYQYGLFNPGSGTMSYETNYKPKGFMDFVNSPFGFCGDTAVSNPSSKPVDAVCVINSAMPGSNIGMGNGDVPPTNLSGNGPSSPTKPIRGNTAVSSGAESEPSGSVVDCVINSSLGNNSTGQGNTSAPRSTYFNQPTP